MHVWEPWSFVWLHPPTIAGPCDTVTLGVELSWMYIHHQIIFQHCLTTRNFMKQMLLTSRDHSVQCVFEISMVSLHRCWISARKGRLQILVYFQITSYKSCNLSSFCLVNNLMNWRHMTIPSTVYLLLASNIVEHTQLASSAMSSTGASTRGL